MRDYDNQSDADQHQAKPKVFAEGHSGFLCKSAEERRAFARRASTRHPHPRYEGGNHCCGVVRPISSASANSVNATPSHCPSPDGLSSASSAPVPSVIVPVVPNERRNSRAM